MAKLHPKLSASGTEHTITIQESPADSPGGERLPLTLRYTQWNYFERRRRNVRARETEHDSVPVKTPDDGVHRCSA